MSKRIFVLILILMFLPITYANTEELNVTIPDYSVLVNGEKIDVEHSQYPILKYKNITYFPMTSDYLSGLGLNLTYNMKDGLSISRTETKGLLKQNFLDAKNTLGSTKKAGLPNFKIVINNKVINNSSEVYPVILYKSIVYFPMTWHFAVDEFGWKTSWSNESGFGITSDVSPLKAVTESQKNEDTDLINISETLYVNGKYIDVTSYKIDLKSEKFMVKTALAKDQIGAVDTLNNIASSHDAVLAINGTYFAAYNKDDGPKDPYGNVIVDGTFVHNGSDRATIGFGGGEIDIDRIDTSILGHNDTGTKILPWYAYWLNHTATQNGTNMTIFDSTRGPETYNDFGTNYVIDGGVVTSVSKDKSEVIPEDGFVINMNGQLGSYKEEVYDRFEVGYKVSYALTVKPENEEKTEFWQKVEHGVSAGPALIINGSKDIQLDNEHFTESKIREQVAARSAVGYTLENELIVVVTTCNIDDLAEIMVQLGCYEAMNLDGGASSGLWLNGAYLREPGRDISNILYITKQ